MCGCKDCKGITLFKGKDGRGIVSITDNGDGTLTVLYTDGTTYITPDFTGPQGDQGIQGEQGEQGIQGDPGPAGPNVKKFVKEAVVPSADALAILILYTEYLPCLAPSEYCGTATPKPVDLQIVGYWYDSVALYWKEFTHYDRSTTYIDALGNIEVTFYTGGGVVSYPINVRIIVKN